MPRPYAGPPSASLELLYRAMEPVRRVAQPQYLDLHHLPASHERLLLVGNHTLFGVLDAPLLLLELWRRDGFWPRGMGDHFHFYVPLWRQLLHHFGVVHGTRELCAQVMAQGSPVLIFPGGGREVAKRRGELHTLVWKQRVGFARMAIEHGYTIVPFAAVGVEDTFEIVWDADDLMRTPLGALVRALQIREDIIWPVVRGQDGLLPKPKRLWFSLGQPIDSSPWAGRHHEDEACWALRRLAQASVEAQIARLRQLAAAP